MELGGGVGDIVRDIRLDPRLRGGNGVGARRREESKEEGGERGAGDSSPYQWAEVAKDVFHKISLYLGVIHWRK